MHFLGLKRAEVGAIIHLEEAVMLGTPAEGCTSIFQVVERFGSWDVIQQDTQVVLLAGGCAVYILSMTSFSLHNDRVQLVLFHV